MSKIQLKYLSGNWIPFPTLHFFNSSKPLLTESINVSEHLSTAVWVKSIPKYCSENLFSIRYLRLRPKPHPISSVLVVKSFWKISLWKESILFIA